MKQQGFTLIELIIACAICGIIAFASSSSYAFIITQSRINKDTNRLLMMLRNTRQMSVTHATTSVLCPSLDNINCVGDWKLPLITFNDSNNNKKRDDGEALNRQFNAFSATDIAIHYPKNQIRFNAQGMASFYNGTLSYCLDQAIVGIIISRTGRIRFAQDLDGDHIPDVNTTTSVSCQ